MPGKAVVINNIYICIDMAASSLRLTGTVRHKAIKLRQWLSQVGFLEVWFRWKACFSNRLSGSSKCNRLRVGLSVGSREDAHSIAFLISTLHRFNCVAAWLLKISRYDMACFQVFRRVLLVAPKTSETTKASQ